MKLQKITSLILAFVILASSVAGCSSSGVLSEEDSNNIRIKPPKDACEGELFYPNPDDYMLTDLRMVNSVGSSQPVMGFLPLMQLGIRLLRVEIFMSFAALKKMILMRR